LCAFLILAHVHKSWHLSAPGTHARGTCQTSCKTAEQLDRQNPSQWEPGTLSCDDLRRGLWRFAKKGTQMKLETLRFKLSYALCRLSYGTSKLAEKLHPDCVLFYFSEPVPQPAKPVEIPSFHTLDTYTHREGAEMCVEELVRAGHARANLAIVPIDDEYSEGPTWEVQALITHSCAVMPF